MSTCQRASFGVLLAMSVLGMALTGYAAYVHLAYTRGITESARSELVATTARAAGDIDAVVSEAMAGVDAVAAGLSDGTLTKDAALDRLRQDLERRARLYGSTVTYAPFGFDATRRLYSAYLQKKDGRIDYVQLDTVYDYTRPEYTWFGPALDGRALWTDPYYDEAARTFMVTYSAPFFRPGPAAGPRRVLGVVTVDISMDEIRRIIESLDLGPSGFGALVSDQGRYLAHPNTDLVLGRKTLAQVADEQHDPDRAALAGRVAARETGLIDHRSTTTGLSAWLSYAPVPSTGWSLQNTFIKDGLPWDLDRMRRQLMAVTIAALVLAIPLSALLLGAYTGAVPRLWAASIVTALLLAGGIGYLWTVALAYDSRDNAGGIPVSDRATLQRVMDRYARASAERHTEPPVFIPTGVFIESASFGATNDLALTGYLWQKYLVGTHDALARGFVVSDATELTISEPYVQREQGAEVVRWRFSATVRHRFDHSRYPLEQEQVGLRILHQDLNHNVVLVPDLSAYKIINPTSLPGLDAGVFLPGWELRRSGFELRNRRYDTNFGLERSLAKEDFPALHFTVVIRRVFLDAFVSNLISVIIVTVLLFTLLMVASNDERLVGFMQAGAGRILSICVAMFFVIAYAHTDVRRKIAAEEIFYLEYFYFLMYFAILWVSINAVLFARGTRLWIIRYRDNLISQLVFWPAVMGLLFAATVLVFR